jgi:MFS family permease
MIFSTAVAILTSVFSPGERGRALGINVTAVYLGLSLGPVLGGILTQYLGWRSIFFVQVPLGLVVIGLILGRMNGEWVEAKGEGFDLTGSMLYGLSLATLIYGLSLLPSSVGVGFLLLSALGLYAFLTWESRAKHPIINLIIFRENRVFALSNLATLINYAASFAVTFVLSLYLQYIQGLDPRSSGLVLMAQPLTQALLSYPAGSLSDRMETRVVASAGMVVTALGLLMLTFLDAGTDLAFILISIAVLGVGLALFSSPNTNAVMSSVERRHYGVASGMLGTMRTIGMMLSMAIVMLIIALFVGRVEILPENHRLFLQSIRAIFYLFLVLCLLGTLASLARGKVRPS